MSGKKWTLNCGCVVEGAKPMQGFRDDNPKRLASLCCRHAQGQVGINVTRDPNELRQLNVEVVMPVISSPQDVEEEKLRHFIAAMWNEAAHSRVKCRVMFVPRRTFSRMQCCFDHLKEEAVRCRGEYPKQSCSCFSFLLRERS